MLGAVRLVYLVALCVQFSPTMTCWMQEPGGPWHTTYTAHLYSSRHATVASAPIKYFKNYFCFVGLATLLIVLLLYQHRQRGYAGIPIQEQSCRTQSPTNGI